MQIEASGLVFDARDKPKHQSHCSFIGLAALSDGGLLCSFQNGSGKHAIDSTVRLCRSNDMGESWELIDTSFDTVRDGLPGSLSSGEIVEVQPNQLRMIATWFDRSDPERPLFDPETEGILHSRQLIASSDDGGNSWSNWREFDIPNLTGCSSTGPILKTTSGQIGYPFESYKEFDETVEKAHAAWVTFSDDDGQSFFEPQQVAKHPDDRLYYWDQRICAGWEPDQFVALFWTHDLVQQRDLNVHLRSFRWKDGELELDPIVETSIVGQIAAPLCLPDGRLLAFVVDRNSSGSLKLWQSADRGKTWLEDDALTIYDHGQQAAALANDEKDFAEYWEEMGKWTFGHPAIQQVSENRVVVCYYAGTTEQLSVHWARVEV